MAHNRDDHTKQISFSMDDGGSWSLAPAYDLTFSEGPGGGHSMALAGRGDPDLAAVLEVARQAGVPRSRAMALAREVSAVVMEGWPASSPPSARDEIARRLRPLA